jgi:hypothetical protein
MGHLFPGDGGEHGAVLLAGISIADGVTLYVRELHIAVEGKDYVKGTIGHRALAPAFIHRMIVRARDERLAYLAVHNHPSDRHVGFSYIDMDSHDRGYPALLQIARGMPVGALVFGERSVQADVWLPEGRRLELEYATVVGNTIDRLTPAPDGSISNLSDWHDRQIRMFGAAGQAKLATCRVAIIGLGGIGSLLSQYLGRLGVGNFLLIDPDRVESSNLSRLVGATESDALNHTLKTRVAERLILEGNPRATIRAIEEDAAKESVSREMAKCDYLFLAADSMRARLVFNAIVHQYLIGGVQLGSKIRSSPDGTLLEVFSANRPVRPGQGCLWCNQLIDPTELAKEAKSDEERRNQAYGVEEPNPSVLSLNAISAAHAVNDFLLDFLRLRPEPEALHYEHFYLLTSKRSLVIPRIDPNCTECSPQGRRFARADSVPLPCIEG